ncbi:uncharacterized protein BDV17DRAFT_30208 [Aspergillus undulatus]|uniref:uncharacterized protein n=1 Tax=Aspergillus undulatus TaxID=1810928 RepID=UPI003CCDCBAD
MVPPQPSALWCAWNGLRGTNSTFLDVPVPDLTGKWIIITGSNNGIGLEAAKTFAKAGANIILGCREPPPWETHPNAAVGQCRELAQAAGHTSTVEWWEINMADLSSVEAFADRWLSTGRALDTLCNNAGMGPTVSNRAVLTPDGLEVLHQVNFASHVLLTIRLLDSLAQSPEPRIICTTSCFHWLGRFDIDHFNGEEGMTGNSYGNNKLYFQAWVSELQRRLLLSEKYKRITVNGVNPGYVSTGIWTNPRPDVGENWGTLGYKLFNLLASLIATTPQQGSQGIVYAATSPEFGPNPDVQGIGVLGGKGGGHYINRIWEAEAMPHCTDDEARLAVWDKVAAELQLGMRGLGRWI